MVKANLNILRNLRLQLKTGFLQKEPPSYKFLQRYPPLSRDTAPPVRPLVKRNIPYLKYYENAVANNPLYADEKVYPAYWAHEPQALTLAKKQYELLQKNPSMSEEEAYQQAIAHVDELENDSFLKLKSVLAELKGARVPYAADTSLMAVIDKWRMKLATTKYEEMQLAEQGEIDWIVQTKVLNWHEVERERRMKDPIFVMQFEKLRASVFPEIQQANNSARLVAHEEYKSRLMTLYGVNKERLCTAQPFYFEDYVRFFKKLKDQPLLGKWGDADREELSYWIIDTLAIREVLEKKTSTMIQRYLDTLRAQYFPMVRYPENAPSYTLPSLTEVKALLYRNDVGYKNQDDRLYIRRAYRLPQLLFPKETLTTSLLTNQEKLSALMSDETSLLSEINRAGLDEATLPELQRQLKEYTSMQRGLVGGSGSATPEDMDMSPLDALLLDDDEIDAHTDGETKPQKDEATAHLNDHAMSSSSAAQHDQSAVLRDLSSYSASSMGEEEWSKLVSRYFKKSKTELETQREALFSMMESQKVDEAEDELDLYHFKRTRTENMVVTRARLAVEYEQKESARRVAEWRSRGVWLEALPRAQLNLIDRRE